MYVCVQIDFLVVDYFLFVYILKQIYTSTNMECGMFTFSAASFICILTKFYKYGYTQK